MLGYLIWHGAGRPRATPERRAIGGAPFLVLEARGGERRVRRRVRRAVAEMAADGVRRFVLDPTWPAAWREGLPQGEEQELRRALLPKLLDWLSEHEELHLGGATVEISAPRADRPVWEAARLLSRRCRYLRLRMDGADELSRDLWRRYGISAGEGGGRAALEICFGQPAGDGPALLLGPGCGERQRADYLLPEPLAERVRPYSLTPQLTAALWMCGAVKTEEIRVNSLYFGT